MITKTAYVCEKCGKEHRSKEAAFECEKCHRTISTVFGYDYDIGCPYPELIHVSLTGVSPMYIYKRYREEPHVTDNKVAKATIKAIIKDKWDR